MHLSRATSISARADRALDRIRGARRSQVLTLSGEKMSFEGTLVGFERRGEPGKGWQRVPNLRSSNFECSGVNASSDTWLCQELMVNWKLTEISFNLRALVVRIMHKNASSRKVLATQRPAYLSSMIHVNQPIRQIWPSSQGVLCSTTPKTAFTSRAFCHVASMVRNKLPNLVNDINSTIRLSEFKQNLKKFPVWSHYWFVPVILLQSFYDFIFDWSWHYGASPAA